jgi:DNA-binding NtrC family response regulator
LAALGSYSFPGNVRELQNVVERALLLAQDATVLPEHLPDEVLLEASGTPAQDRPLEIVSLAEAERRYLRWALATFSGDRRALARRLGLSERTLYRKLSELA